MPKLFRAPLRGIGIRETKLVAISRELLSLNSRQSLQFVTTLSRSCVVTIIDVVPGQRRPQGPCTHAI